jgi:hypothetical protein
MKSPIYYGLDALLFYFFLAQFLPSALFNPVLDGSNNEEFQSPIQRLDQAHSTCILKIRSRKKKSVKSPVLRFLCRRGETCAERSVLSYIFICLLNKFSRSNSTIIPPRIT